MTTASSLAPDRPATRPSADGPRRARCPDDPPSHLRIVAEHEPTSSPFLVEELIEQHVEVARSIASRYRNRGLDLEDLQQVALLGLTKAARRFDPGAGHDFLSYAVPTIRGEVRRHFRDAGWVVRPPRRLQELQARISRAQDDLEQELGRSPRPSELAAHLDVPLDEVVEALSADGCFAPTSLDAPLDDATTGIGDLIGDRSRDTEAAEARLILEPLLARLDDRDRRIVFLRFHEERSQQEIAEAVGITQAQVSRVLARILARLRGGLAD
ncbi:SigB/SigF/SigG family RNA polymerase sigma factor [Nocardioides KLBMP 9356]|uniref:SigB/SigF/SigG family RNA polymerase sigma factor n=1 Tax=Nocardioides potassii TaxID=2911371 RepID=A0ABS9HFF5_9ACTN|nr:SigB/SigF/SigG family RNA polymerase sigma factor [Nocardioides potassii]MCF6379284.1 SigB/SigF/SigG family RNA polymerase sigma factor [Nocardioides potassii]